MNIQYWAELSFYGVERFDTPSGISFIIEKTDWNTYGQMKYRLYLMDGELEKVLDMRSNKGIKIGKYYKNKKYILITSDDIRNSLKTFFKAYELETGLKEYGE